MYIRKGEVFGELTSLTDATRSTEAVEVRCACGKVTTKQAFRLRAGTAKRCIGRSHGFATTHLGLYNVWLSMIYRCHRPGSSSYHNYGERGIQVCDSWRDSFLNFYNDMGDRPTGYELDRIDNDGHYSPDNCRWVTRSKNNRNKRTNRILSLMGESKCLQDWVDDPRTPNINEKTIEKRLRLGWSDYDAIMTPLRS